MVAARAATPTTESDAMADAAAVAAVAQAALEQQQQQQQVAEAVAEAAAAAVGSALPPLPRPLPIGWVMKESRSQPNHYYYFQPETGLCSWQTPLSDQDAAAAAAAAAALMEQNHSVISNTHNNDSRRSSSNDGEDDDENHKNHDENHHQQSHHSSSSHHNPTSPSSSKKTSSSKRSLSESGAADGADNKPSKKSKPSKVRILHILKKHRDSRRPSSWRVAKIDITKDQAKAALLELLDVLQEAKHDPAELRATFEELARTESDCSSAKRGGDLGFFGPKKMQPAFEQASFDLEINELSGIVETSSGVHVLLRIG